MLANRHSLLLVTLSLATLDVCACDCVVLDVKQSAKRADVVLVGRIVSLSNVEITDPSLLTTFPVFVRRAEVEVEHTFKGKVRVDKVIVYTAMEDTDCGVQFEQNDRFVIYAQRDPEFAVQKVTGDQPLYGPGIYWTNSCMRTRPYDEAELKELEALK